jgi:hypothetical protein
MKTPLIIIGVTALVAIGVWQLVKPIPMPAEALVVAQTTPQSPSNEPMRSATPPPALAPSTPTITTAPVRARAVIALKSPLAQEFENAKQLKVFYERYIANLEAATPELKYFAATAIETCVGRARNAAGPTEADRTRFMAKLKDNDPSNAKRIEAFERVNQYCEGFQSLNVTSADAAKLFREAAAAGNAGARVAVAAEDYRETSRNARGTEERRLSEDQLALLRDGLSTGDPFAIQRAGTLLSWQSAQLADRRIGPNGDPFNARDLAPAFTLAACDRGANCGAESYRVLNGCAQQGACGYDNLQTYLQYNELPPNVYVNAQQYRSMILDAIAEGRWDWLGIAPGSGRTVTPPATVAALTRPPRTGGATAPPSGKLAAYVPARMFHDDQLVALYR